MIASWGALLRLARRDARRHPGRAMLVVLLVALPVAGLVAAATLTLTVRPSATELAQADLGAADVAAYQTTADGAAVESPAGLPPGSRVEPVWLGELTVAASGSAASGRTVAAVGVDLAGLGAGMFEVTRGAAPEPGTGQVALTTALAERLGVGLGDTVRTGFGSAPAVGIVRDPTQLDRQAVVMAADLPAPSGFLIGLPAGADAAAVARGLERDGWDATTRADVSRSDPEQLLMILVLGGFGFLVTSLVIASAFAVSAQRRQHDLALLAATGAEARQLRRSVLSSALLLGAGGAALGLVLGVLAPAATLPWLETWTNRAMGGLVLSPMLLAAVAAVGVVVAMAAAWFTSRSAGRTPVAAALTGRHPPRTSSARLLVAGLVGTGLGVAVTVATASSAAANAAAGNDFLTAGGLLLGAALTMLGMGAMSPWLVEQVARRVGRRMPVGVRLAMRDTARFRSRTGPIVMAIGAGLGLSVAVGATLDTVEAGLARDYRPQLAADQLLVDGSAPVPLVNQLREELPVAAAGPLRIVQPADPSSGRRLPEVVTVANARLLAALGAPQATHAALAAGEVLVLHDPDAPPAVAQAEMIAPDGVRVVELDLVPKAVPPIVLSADTLERSGAIPAREFSRWLVRLTSPASEGELAQARAMAERLGQRITVETGPPTINSGALQAGATAGAGVLSLLIVGVGLALISREAQHDDTVLTSVGASPRVRRSLAAARAGTLTFLGGVLAVPAGLLPIWGLSAASDGDAAADLTVPGASILAAVVLVPAIAAGAAWIITRPAATTLSPHVP